MGRILYRIRGLMMAKMFCPCSLMMDIDAEMVATSRPLNEQRMVAIRDGFNDRGFDYYLTFDDGWDGCRR